MKLIRPLLSALSAAILLVPAGVVRAQCTNVNLFPFDPIIPEPSGLVTEISGCNFMLEYSVIAGILQGEDYRFTVSGGAYITVHQGTSDGPVLGHGYSPLTG